MADDLDLIVEIESPLGWLALEDPANGYEMHKESFNAQQHTVRRIEVEGDWSDGGYTTRGTKGNVMENVAVYAGGTTHFEMETRLQALLDSFDQLQYRIRITVGDAQREWTCFKSEYTIETPQEFMVAKIALVRATVPRLPSQILTQVGP